MKFYCRVCKKFFTTGELSGLLPICTCGEDLIPVSGTKEEAK